MDTQFPLAALREAAAAMPETWVTAALARQRTTLKALLQTERDGGSWQAKTALQGALLWLAAGEAGRGDDLVLEAADLAPDAAIVPDWWGLWPQQKQDDQLAELETMAGLYVQLRHWPPLECWRVWLQQVQADRKQLDAPAMRLLLGVVIHGRQVLPAALEPALEQLAGEDLITSEPALAWRLLDALSERLPAWGYGRLKAADLSLQRGDLERCRFHLARAHEEHWQLAWLHDIAARLALAHGDVEPALDHWQEAIVRCEGDGAAAVIEIFRQRAREARRGPGVLQARSLLNRGEQAAAIALLERLLQQDPQWQPLRSLLEQARPARNSAPVRSGELDRFEAHLHRMTERAGLPWPPAQQGHRTTGDAAGFGHFLQQALGRLALLG